MFLKTSQEKEIASDTVGPASCLTFGGVASNGDDDDVFVNTAIIATRSQTVSGTLDFGVRCFTIAWASGRPRKLSAKCVTVETEVIAEVPLATPTMQAVQESWMGLATRRAIGVWFGYHANLARRSAIQDDNVACIRDHFQQFIITITKYDSSREGLLVIAGVMI